MSLTRTIIIPITGQNTLADPTYAAQLRALIGDADNSELISKEEARAEMQALWEAKKAELAQEIADRDSFIKTKRDQLNAAHRAAIKKVRQDAKDYNDAKDDEIEQLKQAHSDEIAAKDAQIVQLQTDLADEQATIISLQQRIAELEAQLAPA